MLIFHPGLPKFICNTVLMPTQLSKLSAPTVPRVEVGKKLFLDLFNFVWCWLLVVKLILTKQVYTV